MSKNHFFNNLIRFKFSEIHTVLTAHLMTPLSKFYVSVQRQKKGVLHINLLIFCLQFQKENISFSSNLILIFPTKC